MFTYRCPGCGKHHAVDKPFEQAFESKCLRCGALIAVTAELIHQSQTASQPPLTLPSPPEGGEGRVRGGREEAIVKAPPDQSAVLPDRSTDTATLAPPASDEVEEEPFAEPRDNGKKNGKHTRDEDAITKKKAARAAAKRRQEEEEEEEEPRQAPRKPWVPPAKPPAKDGKTPRPRWQLIAAVAAVVLIVCGASGYLIFGGKKKPVPPKAAAKTPPKPPSKPKKPKDVSKPKEPEPPKPLTTRDLAISATRLSVELASKGDLANARYAGKVLDVSGLFAKIETKTGLRPPARQHLVFATQGALISCDLQGSPTNLNTWTRLTPDQPITVRGKYEKDGYLSQCTLQEFASTADNNYKGKPLQVSGRVAEVIPASGRQPFPSIRLEGETDSVLEVRCFFRRNEAEEVRKIQPGSALIVEGLCGGRQTEEGVSYVRLDNCRLVYESAPLERMPRLDTAKLLREYEEDMRPLFLPPPGQEERIEGVWTIRQLAKEPLTDAKTFDNKYRYRILHVIGKPQQLGRGDFLMLESGDTDLAFRVECRFAKSEFAVIKANPPQAEYRLRGLCTKMIDPRTLRLDNCQLDVPPRKGPVLTADYFPHHPGRTFAVDVAAFGVRVDRKRTDVARREVHVQGREGITEILVTHSGELGGKSLFDAEVQEKWVQNKKAKVKTPASVGRYAQRLKAGFVDVGTPYLNANGKIDYAWAPILKLQVEAGAKWQWDPPTGQHEYVLEKFGDFHGQPCAYVRETIVLASDVLHPLEILHVYAKGLGEVERREWQLLDRVRKDNKKLLSEMKWVDNPPSARDAGGKPALSTSGDKKTPPPPAKK
jgi:hypothetical protein